MNEFLFQLINSLCDPYAHQICVVLENHVFRAIGFNWLDFVKKLSVSIECARISKYYHGWKMNHARRIMVGIRGALSA